jgi:hypothetical protein
LITLTSENLNVGVYPSDIAISGTTHDRTRARAAIVSRLATASAHMTTSKEAQEVEDRLGKLARQDSGAASGRGARAELEEIDATLLDLAVPTDEWDILYRIRLQIERDLLIGAEPGTAFPGHEPDTRDAAAPRSSRRGEMAPQKERERADRANPVAKGNVA